MRRPSLKELRAAVGRTVPDVIASGLRVLFCGINPGLYSAAVRHHFARPGNRFWPALHVSGFTPRLLYPWEERELLSYGLGVTNLVARATATDAELNGADFVAGRRRLEGKILRYQPSVLAVLGVGAYRLAFERPRAAVGEQDERINGTRIWVLPNPSGLNANYKPAQFAAEFRRLRESLER